MDVHMKSPATSASLVGSRLWLRYADRAVLIYWGLSALLGFVFLRDWLVQWNVGATIAYPWLIGLLIATWAVSQLAYAAVAEHGNRPLRWDTALLFAIGNGVFETFAFALVYRAGEAAGSTLVGLFAPGIASGAGFALGVVFFVIYGGLIHGLFWLQLLPPHLNDTPRSRAIRRRRPLIEIALVLAWSLCLWLTRDIWSVIFFHTLVDLFLMILVRPPLFLPARRSGVR